MGKTDTLGSDAMCHINEKWVFLGDNNTLVEDCTPMEEREGHYNETNKCFSCMEVNLLKVELAL